MQNCQALIKKYFKFKKKHLLIENEMKKIKTLDLSYFLGKSHFDEDGAQNYLVFQSMFFSVFYAK